MNQTTHFKSFIALTILSMLIFCCSCAKKEAPVTEETVVETTITEAATLEDETMKDIQLDKLQFYATDLVRISDDENSIMYQANAVDYSGYESEIIFVFENKEENELDTHLNYIFTTKGIQTMSIPPQMPVASYEVVD